MRTTLHFFFLEGISAGELMFVFFIVLLFFGSKSIPKMARTFGRAMRQIRDASQQIQDDIRNSTNDDISSSVIKKQETNTDD